MTAIHDEAAGRDRREPLEARGDPVFGRDRFEGQGADRRGPGSRADDFADRLAVERIRQIKFDNPAAVAGLDHGRCGFGGVELLGDVVGDAPSRPLVGVQAGNCRLFRRHPASRSPAVTPAPRSCRPRASRRPCRMRR